VLAFVLLRLPQEFELDAGAAVASVRVPAMP